MLIKDLVIKFDLLKLCALYTTLQEVALTRKAPKKQTTNLRL